MENNKPKKVQKEHKQSKEHNILNRTIYEFRFFQRIKKNKDLKKVLSKEQWSERKYKEFQYKHNLNSMRYSIAKRSWLRISVVWLSLLASSILILVATILPSALLAFKSGLLSGFGQYNSYSEYQSTLLNVPVAKWNLQQTVTGQENNDNSYGGFNPINGNPRGGTDNRYDYFDPNDRDQSTMNSQLYENNVANFSYMGYLGGAVLNSIWVNELKNNAQLRIAGPTICQLMGVPWKSTYTSGADCIMAVIKQNAPSYMQQKLFGEANPNYYLSFGKIAYQMLTDNLFTHIDGSVDNSTLSTEIWGLNENGDYSILDSGGNNLIEKLYNTISSGNYKNTDKFPCVINQTFYNQLFVNRLIKKDPDGQMWFTYKVPYKVMEIRSATDPNKWYLANPNDFFWTNNPSGLGSVSNGETVYYDLGANGEGPSGGQAVADFNGTGIDVGNNMSLVDFLISSKGAQVFSGTAGANLTGPAAREATLYTTVRMDIAGVAKQYGDGRIYTTHSEANEIGGYYSSVSSSQVPNITNFYSKNPIGFYNSYNNPTAGNGTELDVSQISNSQGLLNAGIHLACDGHPDSNKTYGPTGTPTNIGVIPGGYTLNSYNASSGDIYFNGKLTKDVDNKDLSNFMLTTTFGNYDKYGMTTPSGGWDPTNPGNGWVCTPGKDNTCVNDGSSNSTTSSVQNLFSKQLVLTNIDRIIVIVLSVIFGALAFLIIISLIIILVSTNIIIDDNKKNISSFKIMGYNDKDISKITLGIYYYVSVLAFLVAIPIVLFSFTYIMNEVGNSTGLGISGTGLSLSDYFAVWQIPLAAFILFLVYFTNVMINKKILNKIKAIDVLKR